MPPFPASGARHSGLLALPRTTGRGSQDNRASSLATNAELMIEL